MTPGERLYEHLAAARARNGGTLTRQAWIDAADQCLIEQAIAKKKSPTRTKADRPRNELFDTLATACGCRDVSQLTRNGAKAVGVAMADIREVAPHVTAAEIQRVVDAYKHRHPTWSCTPTAIAKNWAEFAKSDRTSTGKRDIYQEPPGWKQSNAARLAMNASLETWALVCERGWFDLSPDIRADILKAVF